MKKSWLVLSTLGAGFLFLAAGNTPAFAKDRGCSSRHDIESEIRRDEVRLASLENRDCAQRSHHNYRAARCTESEIRAVRRNIENDRCEIRHDVRASYRDDPYGGYRRSYYRSGNGGGYGDGIRIEFRTGYRERCRR